LSIMQSMPEALKYKHSFMNLRSLRHTIHKTRFTKS
jgi:hypothetical protein